MTPPTLTVAQAQHVNRARSLAVARSLSDASLDLHVVRITIDTGGTTIQLTSSADAATVVDRLGWIGEPVVEEFLGNVHHSWERDVDGIVVRVVGLDPIDGATP